MFLLGAPMSPRSLPRDTAWIFLALVKMNFGMDFDFCGGDVDLVRVDRPKGYNIAPARLQRQHSSEDLCHFRVRPNLGRWRWKPLNGVRHQTLPRSGTHVIPPSIRDPSADDDDLSQPKLLRNMDWGLVARCKHSTIGLPKTPAQNQPPRNRFGPLQTSNKHMRTKMW